MILDAIDEVYYGGSKYTKAIEDCFVKIGRLKEEDHQSITAINELEDAIENFSGIITSIDLEKDAICYTIPIEFKEPPKIRKTQERIIVDTVCLFLVTFSPKFLFDRKSNPKALNSGELTAVVLHEIGHNLNASVLPLANSLNSLKRAISSKTNLVVSGKINERERDNFISYIGNAFKMMSQTDPDSIGEVLDISKLVMKSIFAKLLPFQDDKRYLEEKFADSYATIYGYGPQLASALKRIEGMGLDYHAKQKNKFIKLTGQLNALVMQLIFDEHPNTLARINNISEQLQYELDHNKLKPEVRSNIKKQLIELKGIAKQYEIMVEKKDTPRSIYYSMLKNMIPNNTTGDFFGNLVSDLFTPKMLDDSMKK